MPQTDDLQVEAKVNPQDIDKLQIGQKTLLRLSAFNQRTTPELNGVVSRVSPDVTTDQRTGQSYYTIRVSMPPEEVARLGEVKLIPGMPVEAFVQTGDRTMLSYLIKPLQRPADARVPREVRVVAPRSSRPLKIVLFSPSPGGGGCGSQGAKRNARRGGVTVSQLRHRSNGETVTPPRRSFHSRRPSPSRGG